MPPTRIAITTDNAIQTTREELKVLIERFPFGQKLAREALNIYYPPSGNRKGKKKSKCMAFKEKYEDCQGRLIQYLKSWTKWKKEEWLDNVKDIREHLMRLIAPDIVEKYTENGGFKLFGKRADSFGNELSEYVANLQSKWKSSGLKNRMRDARLIDSCINALETMILGCCVDASLRKCWIQQLVELCRSHHKMPESLKITDVKFDSPDFFNCGGSADIYKATIREEQVVVKFLRESRESKVTNKKGVWGPLHEEALNWLGLDHPGINPFLGITYEHPRKQTRIGLVFKYQRLGNVTKFLADSQANDKVEFVRAKFMYIVSAIHFLHEMDLVHGDIKGYNILVGQNDRPLLTDFGLMRRVAIQSPSEKPLSVTGSTNESSVSSHSCGDFSLRWASKERVHDSLRTQEDDVWALGMTLIELLTGKVPFSDMLEGDFLKALFDNNLKLEHKHLPENIQDDLFRVIERCLVQNPNERLTAFELYTLMSDISGKWAIEELTAPS